MREWAAYLFAAMILFFAFAVLYTVFRFHVRSLREQSVHRGDLNSTRRKVVRIALVAWVPLATIFVGVNLWGQKLSLEWLFLLLLCLMGPMLFSLAALWSQVTVLKGIYRLPIVNGDVHENSIAAENRE